MALKSGLFMPTTAGRMQGIAEMAASHVPYDSLSDAEVMLRAGTDDNAAYEYLVTKYHRPMIAFMYRMCHNQALAEELAQEVFLRVYRSKLRRKACRPLLEARSCGNRSACRTRGTNTG